MNNNRKRKPLSAFRLTALFVAGVMMLGCFAFGASAESDGITDISPAISVIRAATRLYKCGVKGEALCFSRTDCESVYGIMPGCITVVSLPRAEDGVLRLNGVPVISGQTVSASSVDYITFTSKGNAVSASFSFRSDVDGWEAADIECRIDISEDKVRNRAPALSSGQLKTFKNAKAEYALSVYEPDDDDVDYRVCEYPASGSVSIRDGMLVYTPVSGFSGKDSVTLTASDIYGNESPQAVIDIEVKNSDIVFADMKNSSAHAAAVSLAHNNIVAYRYKDGQYFYDPFSGVSRADFLVMLMSAAETDIAGAGASVPFTDTEGLNEGRLKYIAKALALGVVSDVGAFRPNDDIVRSEAAVWVSRLLRLDGAPASFTDLAELDAETAACVAAVSEAGIFVAKDGRFAPAEVITREEAARILYRITR